MKLSINSFGWGLPTHDVKEDAVKKDVDSKVVTAQLDALRDSVNGITAALDSLLARIVAEIQVNDPKQEVSFPKNIQNVMPSLLGHGTPISLNNIYGRQHPAKQSRLAARRTSQ